MDDSRRPACLGRAGIGATARREGHAVAIVLSSPQGALGEAVFDTHALEHWIKGLSTHLLLHPPMRGAEGASFRIGGGGQNTLTVKDLGLSSPRILLELSARGSWWQEARFDEADFLQWLKELGAYVRNS